MHYSSGSHEATLGKFEIGKCTVLQSVRYREDELNKARQRGLDGVFLDQSYIIRSLQMPHRVYNMPGNKFCLKTE